MKTRYRLLSILSLLILAIAVVRPAQAQKQPFLNLGLTSFLDGIPPSGPGIYLQNYSIYYNASEFKDGNGDAVPNFPSLDLFVEGLQLTYLNHKILPSNMRWGLNAIMPIFLVNTQGGQGFGDLLFGPFLQWEPIMGKKGPIFSHRVELSTSFPTGRYNNLDPINPGNNSFFFNPYWAMTAFPVPEWDISLRLHYLWNGSNNDPNVLLFPGARSTQAGQAFHMNFASSYEVWPKRVRLGINTYFLSQFTDSKVSGVSVPGSREQVLGLGVGGVFSISRDDFIFVNGYVETLAENRPEGSLVNLRYVHNFAVGREDAPTP